MLISLLIIILAFNLPVSGKTDVLRHVENSIVPFNKDPPEYNIETWVSELNLQHCVIVEIGEPFLALFVEFRHTKGKTDEYFVGICNTDVFLKWKLCSSILEQQRPKKCTFRREDMLRTRVHRRLCDFAVIAPFAERCDCQSNDTDTKLYKVTGFPTCFASPLPETLCGSLNICGVSSCTGEIIGDHVFKFECNPNCIGHDNFCQFPMQESSYPAKIASWWSDWSIPFCLDLLCRTIVTEARCINSETGKGAIDCLGPGTSCCPTSLRDCKCHLYLEGSMMKVVRMHAATQINLPIEGVEIYQDSDNYVDYIDYLVDPKEGIHDEEYSNGWIRRTELNRDPHFARIYASRYPINMKDAKLAQRDVKDEDFEDDDEPEDNEDNNEEDIMIEEEVEVRATTLAQLEKDDIAQQQGDSMRKNVLEMALDDEIKEELNQQNLTVNCGVNLHKTHLISILTLTIVNCI